MRSGFLIGALVVAAVVVLGLTYYFQQAEAPPDQVQESPVPAAEPAPEPRPSEPPGPGERTLAELEQTPPSPVITEPSLVLPALGNSDPFVRERLPETIPEAWVDRGDLLRRLAVLVENTARGELPKRQLSFLAPEGRFAVRETPGAGPDEVRLFVDPESYRRYDRYVDILESVPPATLADLVLDAYPLIEEALHELDSDEPPLNQLLAGIDQVLAVPVLTGEVELVQPKVLYEYADPALEGLTPLQKQVLRMGPDNVVRVQAYLVALRDALSRR